MIRKKIILEKTYEHKTKDPGKLPEKLGLPVLTIYRKMKRIKNGEGLKLRPGTGSETC